MTSQRLAVQSEPSQNMHTDDHGSIIPHSSAVIFNFVLLQNVPTYYIFIEKKVHSITIKSAWLDQIDINQIVIFSNLQRTNE